MFFCTVTRSKSMAVEYQEYFKERTNNVHGSALVSSRLQKSLAQKCRYSNDVLRDHSM